MLPPVITVFLNHQNCENVRGRTFSFRKHINSPFSSVTKRIPAASTAAPLLTALTGRSSFHRSLPSEIQIATKNDLSGVFTDCLVATKLVRAEDESCFSRVPKGCSSPVTPIANATHCARRLVTAVSQVSLFSLVTPCSALLPTKW